MKKCNKCGNTSDNFSKSARSKDGLQSICRLCSNAAAIKNYKENADRYKRKAKERTARLRLLIDELKSVPCADCKNVYDPICMDFDHLPGSGKEFNISELRRRKFSVEKILKEISKCEVVCSNCHRLRTKNRNEETSDEE